MASSSILSSLRFFCFSLYLQFEVMKVHTNLQVEEYYGAKGVDEWNAKSWEKEINDHDSFWMRHQDSIVLIVSLGVGINYGQIANNLPSPSHVANLLGSLNISRVKLDDADPNVLSAFANSNIDFVIGLGNEYLLNMTDPLKAQNWIELNVQPFITHTKISCITVGNEILTGNDTQLKSYLLPAMQTIYGGLQNLGLSKQVYVSLKPGSLVSAAKRDCTEISIRGSRPWYCGS
ncbi:Glucan endo-1,3-beta-glucosidase 14 [Camellia lanceoleosa]|uniref:Glucan endo-1,3-beta-glucosidase 14 n=1 Tax=Camellia lanceoleosa TaxID=1840588 RepID=A0ACC0GTC1_9ERIC|nr:Glucan endo-1,3-beta-glucosidase 14 [Camellia lanceoleosa]